MDVDVEVGTDDGRFAEKMKGTLRGEGLIEVFAEEPIEALKGTFSPTFTAGQRGLEIDISRQGEWVGRMVETSMENGSKRLNVVAVLPRLVVEENRCARARPVAR